MTDTQGYDTASGGLENDMPGLENAPASPRPGSSGLGGIANYARMALGIGAPAPQAPKQGRSPWQYPGQSQIPPEAQQPGQPRWEGTTASLALPKFSQQPPAVFTRFHGSLPTRDWRQWGKPEPYGNLPQSFELGGITKGLGQFFGQMGGGMDKLALVAFAMTGHADDYIKGVMLGEEYRSKLAKERWLEKSYQLQDELEKRHTLYADTLGLFNEYTNGDPTKLDTVRIKGMSWRDRMAQDASQTDDKDILQMLHDGRSAQQIMDYQNLRDSRLKDLQKVNEKAQQQEAEDNKAREDAGLPPQTSSRSSSDPLAPRPRDDQAATPEPGQVSAGGPAPTKTAQAGGGQPPSGGDQTQPLLPYQEDGNEVVRGEANLHTFPKAIQEGVSNWAAQQGAKLDQIKNDAAAGRIKPEDIPTALDKVIPGAGEEYTNTLEGAPLPTGPAGKSKYWQTIKGLIPGFNPVVQAQTFRDFAPGGKDGTRIIAGWRMGPAAVNVLKALKNIPEGEVIPYYMADMLIAGRYTGDPKYVGLFNALNSYVQEAQALNSPTGRFFVTEVESIKKQLQTASGPKAIRTVLQQDAETSTKLLDGLNQIYKRNARTQSDAPTWQLENTSILRALVNLDPSTGFSRYDQEALPAELRGLGLGSGVNQDTGQKTGVPEQPGLPGGWNWK